MHLDSIYDHQNLGDGKWWEYYQYPHINYSDETSDYVKIVRDTEILISIKHPNGKATPNELTDKVGDKELDNMEKVQLFFDEHPLHPFGIVEIAEYLNIKEVEVCNAIYKLIFQEYIDFDWTTDFSKTLFKRNPNADFTSDGGD